MDLFSLCRWIDDTHTGKLVLMESEGETVTRVNKTQWFCFGVPTGLLRALQPLMVSLLFEFLCVRSFLLPPRRPPCCFVSAYEPLYVIPGIRARPWCRHVVVQDLCGACWLRTPTGLLFHRALNPVMIWFCVCVRSFSAFFYLWYACFFKESKQETTKQKWIQQTRKKHTTHSKIKPIKHHERQTTQLDNRKHKILFVKWNRRLSVLSIISRKNVANQIFSNPW